MEGARPQAADDRASNGVDLFEADGRLYGHLSGKFLINADGACTHMRGGTGGRYLYSVKGRRLEFRRDGDRFLAIADGTCRWLIGG